MFEIRAGELRATFLRNHNMRRHKDPKQKTAQAEDNSSPEGPRNPDSRHKHGGAAPVTWRCTRTEEVHCLQIGCSAPTHKNKRGTVTPNHSPPHPSMRSWTLQVAGRARRPRHHLHSGPLQHLPHPKMRRARFLVRGPSRVLRPCGQRCRGSPVPLGPIRAYTDMCANGWLCW